MSQRIFKASPSPRATPAAIVSRTVRRRSATPEVLAKAMTHTHDLRTRFIILLLLDSELEFQLLSGLKFVRELLAAGALRQWTVRGLFLNFFCPRRGPF